MFEKIKKGVKKIWKGIKSKCKKIKDFFIERKEEIEEAATKIVSTVVFTILAIKCPVVAIFLHAITLCCAILSVVSISLICKKLQLEVEEEK